PAGVSGRHRQPARARRAARRHVRPPPLRPLDGRRRHRAVRRRRGLTMGLDQRILGRSGLRVSDACLGTMTFGTSWGFGADEATCREIYAAFREAGGTFVDTANNYTNGESEEILGRLLAGERDEVVVSTKFTLPTAADPNSGG